jgi:hypothetical protein
MCFSLLLMLLLLSITQLLVQAATTTTNKHLRTSILHHLLLSPNKFVLPGGGPCGYYCLGQTSSIGWYNVAPHATPHNHDAYVCQFAGIDEDTICAQDTNANCIDHYCYYAGT